MKAAFGAVFILWIGDEKKSGAFLRESKTF